jgi:hypothetical protein
MVSRGTRTAAEAARLFRVHPATVSRLLSCARVSDSRQHRNPTFAVEYAK